MHTAWNALYLIKNNRAMTIFDKQLKDILG